MVTMRFKVIDMFRSNRLALSLQRIWIQFVGLIVGYIGYYILTVLSLYLAGLNFTQILSQYGLFPCLFILDIPIGLISKIVFSAGCIYLVIVLLITNTAVSRAVFMVLRGNNFYTWREAFAFAIKKSGSIILTPVVIGMLIIAFIIGAWVIGMIGRIPFIGELGISFFSIIWLCASLVVVFLVIVTGVAIILTPAILATTEEDSFEAIFQSFSTTWSQPWRIVIYEGIAGGLSILGFLVMAILIKCAFVLMNNLLSFSMQDAYINMATQAQYLLQSWTLKLEPILSRVFGELKQYFFFARDFIPLELSPTLNISAYLVAINMMIVGGLIISYLLATFNSGNTIMYLIFRKIKDDENLLERQDRYSEEQIDDDIDKKEHDKTINDIVKSDEALESSIDDKE